MKLIEQLENTLKHKQYSPGTFRTYRGWIETKVSNPSLVIDSGCTPLK